MTTEGKLAVFVLVACIFYGPRPSAPMAVTLISPDSITVNVGETVLLICSFQLPGNCSWTRNGLAVPIPNGLKYFAHGNDSQKMNCWISIPTVKEQDAGNWTCTIPAYRNSQWMLAKTTYLHVKGNKKEITKTEANPPVTQTEDENTEMLTAIVILAIIVLLVTTIAVGLMYILCHRAKAARPQNYAPINQQIRTPVR